MSSYQPDVCAQRCRYDLLILMVLALFVVAPCLTVGYGGLYSLTELAYVRSASMRVRVVCMVPTRG